ncbi:class I SAM-dependent methyltransferase, partial [Streptomyces boncukensis]
FYLPLVMEAGAVLDVGCGTGSLLHRARERGHRGRLAGLDPDPAALERARRRTDVEWVQGAAVDAGPSGAFELVTMTGHAFQDLVTDDEVRASLAAIHGALCAGGRFAFETRHPQARAWERWSSANPDDVAEFVDGAGRALRYGHEVESVDGDLVTVRGTVAAPDGTVLRVLRERLRFLGAEAVTGFLVEAGFVVDGQFGGWDREAVTASSREVITLARRV